MAEKDKRLVVLISGEMQKRLRKAAKASKESLGTIVRRGLATNLYALGCPSKIAQAILRHGGRVNHDAVLRKGASRRDSSGNGEARRGVSEIREACENSLSR